MLLAADVIDTQLQAYLQAHGIQEVWGAQERILVCITPRSNARQMLESGRRNADRFHGELFAVYVRQSQPVRRRRSRCRREIWRSPAKLAHGSKCSKVTTMCGTLIRFAREHGVTQIFIGHSMREGWWYRLRGNPVERLIELAEGMDVRVFPQGTPRLSHTETTHGRGRLKVYLGYAAGAGKTLPHARGSPARESRRRGYRDRLLRAPCAKGHHRTGPKGWKSFRAERFNTAAAVLKKWIRKQFSGGRLLSVLSTNLRTPTFRDRSETSAGRMSSRFSIRISTSGRP